MGESIGIVGSRDYKHLDKVEKYIKTLPKGTIVVSGGARGVDTRAERIAREMGLKVKIHKANWDRYGLSAGPIRNRLIVGDSHRIVAFWDGKSKGTQSTIEMAKFDGKDVLVINDEDD